MRTFQKVVQSCQAAFAWLLSGVWDSSVLISFCQGKGVESGNKCISFQRHGLEACSSRHWAGWAGSCGHSKQSQKLGLQASAEFRYNDDQQLTVLPTVPWRKCGCPGLWALFLFCPLSLSGLLLPSWLVLGGVVLYWVLTVAQQRSESLHWFYILCLTFISEMLWRID